MSKILHFLSHMRGFKALPVQIFIMGIEVGSFLTNGASHVWQIFVVVMIQFNNFYYKI